MHAKSAKRSFTLAAALAAGLLILGGCTNPPEDEAGRAGNGANLAGAPGATGAGQGAQAGAAVPGSQQDLQQSAGDRVFFATDQSGVSAEGRQILQRQAEWLKRYPNIVVSIEGHCDERGTREYNLALGARRADAAKEALVALGIAADRITTVSYGKERPAVAGSTEAAWAQNRRAVTVVQ